MEVVKRRINKPGGKRKLFYSLCKQINGAPVIYECATKLLTNPEYLRHYYLEAMKLVEEGTASFENVDAVMEIQVQFEAF